MVSLSKMYGSSAVSGTRQREILTSNYREYEDLRSVNSERDLSSLLEHHIEAAHGQDGEKLHLILRGWHYKILIRSLLRL